MTRKTSGDSKQFLAVSPVFQADDPVKTAEYYRDVLGFTYTWSYGDPIVMTCVTRDQAHIFFNSRQSNQLEVPHEVKRGSYSDLYIFVHDVEAVYQELKSRGAEIVGPPEVYDYGMKDFDVRDLNGYIISIGQDVNAYQALPLPADVVDHQIGAGAPLG